MTKPANPIIELKPRPPACLRKPTIACIAAIVLDDTPIETATREAGLHDTTLPKALAKPEVQKYIKDLQSWALRQKQNAQAAYMIEAVEAARALMTDAENESVRMRAIEFVRSAVNPVHKPELSPRSAPNEPQNPPGPEPVAPGYGYERPTDSLSEACDDNDQQNKGNAGDE
jgi:hypothetical protein